MQTLKMGSILEQRQNKKDTIWSISKSILKLPPFFNAGIGEWKKGGKFKATLSFYQMESFLQIQSK